MPAIADEPLPELSLRRARSAFESDKRNGGAIQRRRYQGPRVSKGVSAKRMSAKRMSEAYDPERMTPERMTAMG